MHKPTALVLFLLASGCQNYDSSTFNVENIDYSTLKENSPVAELRVYEYKSPQADKCVFQGSGQSIAATLAISVIGYAGKEAIAYGKSELEKRAEYLESDVVLNGKSLHASKWPNAADAANNSLCVLIVAGEFSGSPDPEVARRFRDSQLGDLDDATFNSTLQKYAITAPGSSSQISNPFAMMSKDPAFILEAKIVSAKDPAADKWQYYVIPTYLFYPKPLHRMAKTGLSRNLTVDITLGDAKSAIDLSRFKSGNYYGPKMLAPRFAITDEKGATPSAVMTVKVVEGPDKMPTAKALRAAASKDAELQAWLDGKLKELEAKISKP